MELIQTFKEMTEYQYLKIQHLIPNRAYTIVTAVRSPTFLGNSVYLLLRNIHNPQH
jgi:hypothetical protein